VDIAVVSEPVSTGVAVRVEVRLSGRETSRLFVNGDTLIQLPLDGARADEEGAPMPRPSIFLSELAGMRGGLERVFSDQAAADAFAAAVRAQLETALEDR
jgi:hypothetical protein